MSDTNSTTHDSQRETLISRLSRMLIQGVHLLLALLQTSQVAVVALLIDGENISPDLTAQMLVEAGKFGGVTIRRVYANITSPNIHHWKEVITHYPLHAILQIQPIPVTNASTI